MKMFAKLLTARRYLLTLVRIIQFDFDTVRYIKMFQPMQNSIIRVSIFDLICVNKYKTSNSIDLINKHR